VVEVSASGPFAEGTGFRACSEASGGLDSLRQEEAALRITLASLLAWISSSKDWRACKISDLMEASVRERVQFSNVVSLVLGGQDAQAVTK